MKADRTEILRALNLLAEPGQVIELRILHTYPGGQRVPVTMSGYFTDHERLTENAVKYSAVAQGVYVTLNPVNPALLARSANRTRVAGKDAALTKDGDVGRRRWLPIDFDPVRPSGISSTEPEHDSAIARAVRVREALRNENWPEPILADSGNGAHLLYLIDLPSNDEGTVKRCLQALAARFDDDTVKIDQSVFNPARIWKLYGTASRKGDNLPDRPHRIARILEAV